MIINLNYVLHIALHSPCHALCFQIFYILHVIILSGMDLNLPRKPIIREGVETLASSQEGVNLMGDVDAHIVSDYLL